VNEGDTIGLSGPAAPAKHPAALHQFTDRSDGGQIFLDGNQINASGINEDEVRQHIGMVFQNFLLFNHLTALDNVMVGLTKSNTCLRSNRPGRKQRKNWIG
jgi:polar amino acid transport system ATP-binding protein